MNRIRNITVSGRIASGTTTLAKGLSEALGWELFEGGSLFEKYHHDLGVSETDANLRPDELDLQFEEKIKKMLEEKSEIIIQSHLAGFDAQGINGVFKILVVCEDKDGKDKTEIRVDRLVNRKGISIEEAKFEVKEREKKNLEKWRRLYAENDSQWVYWNEKYYDLIVNTYSLNKNQVVEKALTELKPLLFHENLNGR